MTTRNSEAVERLNALARIYFHVGDMRASRADIIDATYKAYPLTDREIGQLHNWGWHSACEHGDAAHDPTRSKRFLTAPMKVHQPSKEGK